MTRARASLLLLLAIATVAAAACETQKKPIRGFDKQPPGSILLDPQAPGAVGALTVWPMFDLPVEAFQLFHVRLNDQDAVLMTSEDGFYDYAYLYLQGWTTGRNSWFTGIVPGSYVVEIVDGSGRSWGRSEPVTVSAGLNPWADPNAPGSELPAVIFANFDGKVASWNVDPLLKDADPATDEITVTNLVDEDVIVERCMVAASGDPTSCTPVGTIAPGADLHTVETVAGLFTEDHQGLRIRVASDGRLAYLRELDEGSGNFGPPHCQVERIIVHGNRWADSGLATGPPWIAFSSCYGYQSGPA